MRRMGVSPWVATATAAILLFYGSGAENVVWAFQITFTGAIALGLAHLLLADDEAPGPRRVLGGWACGIGALMCSGVGLIMAVVVGLAVLLRHGWRAAFRSTAPVGVVYGAWYLAYGRDVLRQPGVGAGLVLDFVLTGIRRATVTVGQHGPLVVALVVLVAGGLLLAVWADRRSLADLRRHLGIPIAFGVGTVGFFVVTGVSRAGAFGTSFATRGRYSYFTVALFAPVVAIAADAVIQRWRYAAVPALLILVSGIPGNLGAVQVRRNDQVTASQVIALAYSPALATKPRATVLFPEASGARSITVGWPRHAAAHGRFPNPGVLTPDDRANALLRLALETGPDDAELQRCTLLTTEETVPIGPRRVVVPGRRDRTGRRSGGQSVGRPELRKLQTHEPQIDRRRPHAACSPETQRLSDPVPLRC